MHTTPQPQGTTLVEIIVGVSVMLIVFGAFFFAASSFIRLTETNRQQTAARLVATEYIETIRALPYDSVGTIGGLPYGGLPQTQTITRDGRTYYVRTFIQYVDDPADGLGAGDTLAADYKRVKVEVSYTVRTATSSVSFVTTVAPKSQESLAGAGILNISVLDAANNPVPSATVHILNTTVATSVDITTFTNASGTVSFPGAWAGAGYEVNVSKLNYSNDGTYTSSVTNPDPDPSPLTVAENSTTEIIFNIDRLSTLAIQARSLPQFGSFHDSFTDGSGLAVQTDTAVTGSVLVLGGTPGSYPANGTAVSQTFSPATLGAWGLFYADISTPPSTQVLFHFEYETGGIFLPVPESDLPGNAAGFAGTPMLLKALDPATYGSLRIVAVLASSDPNVTPAIDSWRVSYRGVDAPRNGLTIGFRGGKTIGMGPVYKYNQSHVTDGSGLITLADMEYDEYTITPSGVTLVDLCPPSPVLLLPNTPLTVHLTTVTPTAHSYRVALLAADGSRIPDAEVVLANGSGDSTALSGSCGIAFVNGLSADTYTVTARAEGYAATTTVRAISGAREDVLILTP